MPPRTTLERIHRQAQTVARLELKLAKQKNDRRRADTRHKILLGGLLIKAKLDGLPFPVLLGGLLDIEQQLIAEPHVLDVFHAKGEAVFLGFQSVEKVPVGDAMQQHHYLETMKTPEMTAVIKPEALTQSLPSELIKLRQATRHKIQLGGLIIKANLALLSKAQLLGALATLAESLRRQPILASRYGEVGRAALAGKPS